MRTILRVGAALFLASLAACGPRGPGPLDIATTTSVQNSGLLDAILPEYEQAAGVDVRVHAAGSGRALQMLDEGLVRLVISHAPETEARMLAAHPGWYRVPMAHNWFVIVGPPADPAGVRRATDVVDVMRRIVTGGASFVSRGDQSGTHERENELWDAAGVRPTTDRLIVSGRGMAQALRHADEALAYTLTDEATFRQLEPTLDLEVLHAGDERLKNPYSVLYPVDDAAAGAFARWLTEGEGRQRIAQFTIQGRPAFDVPEK